MQRSDVTQARQMEATIIIISKMLLFIILNFCDRRIIIYFFDDYMINFSGRLIKLEGKRTELASS